MTMHFSTKIALDSHAQLMMLIPLALLLLATATATAHASASATEATAHASALLVRVLSVTFILCLFFEIPRGPSACKSIPSRKPRDPQWAPCTELVSHQHEQVIPRSFHWHYSSQSLSAAGQGLLARLELQQELKFFFVLRCSSRWCS